MPSIPVFAADTSVATRLMRPDVEKPTIDAGAIQRASQAVTNAYNAEQARQRQEQDQLAANEARLQVINTGSDLELRARQQLEDDATNGNMSGATDRLMTNWDQWTSDALANASPKAQPVMQAHLAEMRGRLNVTAYQAEMQSRMEGVSNDFLTGVESDRKLVYADPSQAADTLARRIGLAQSLQLPQKQKDALTTSAREGIAFDASAGIVDRDPAAFLSRAGMGPGAAPDAAEKALKSDPIIGSLNPQAYRTLIDHAQARLAALGAASQRENDAHLQDAQKAIQELSEFVDTGAAPSLQYSTTIANRVANTPYADAADQLLNAARSGAGFGAQTLPRQREALVALSDQLRQGSSPDDQKQLDRLRTINASQEKAYADNPWDAANRFAHVPAQPQVDIGSAADGLSLAAARMKVAPSVEAAAGTAVSPFQPAEAEAFGRAVRALPIDQQATALDQLGKILGTGDRISAFANQIKDKDGTLSLAMAYAGQGTTQGRVVSELLLRGSQALKDDRVLVDQTKDTGWKGTIAKTIRGAYSDTQVEDKTIEAAFLIAAGQYAETGNAPDLDSAVRLATGGIVQHGAAGAKIPLPWGMDEKTFNQKLGAITPDALKVQAPDGVVLAGNSKMDLPTLVHQLPDATLVHAGQGRYNVRGGSFLVTNSKGQRITLVVK